MCGPGVPVGCKSGHMKPLMCGAGGCWLQDEACEVKVLKVLRLLRVWRVLSVWRVWRVWRVLGRANGRLGRP